MDVESYLKMICPIETKSQCNFWLNSVIAGLAIVAILTTILHISQFENWTPYKQLLMSFITVGSVFWSIWVVIVLRGIIQWWVKMHSQLDNITTLLSEIKSDIKEIKLISDHSHLQ